MKKLTPFEEQVIIHKATEAPFSGEFYENNRVGKYFCKRCGFELFSTKDQFHSGCGWPSFDDEIGDSVKKILDADGRRTEILCKNCDGHLGHIFHGEGFTTKDTRYCVNSISLEFIEEEMKKSYEKAYFAAGCFWGVEYYFSREKGVISAISGYMGGKTENPSYEEVCAKNTGHLEVVEVVFDKNITDFETLARLFFEIHDPEQENGQGPDLGEQYVSAIFCLNNEQKKIAQNLIEILEKKGLKVATKLLPMAKFWNAELYHQSYYTRNGKTPYCHKRVQKF
ncbi:MAG: bifunctional methionine sulfoxide reductase B/A protein [Pelagibacterales bacterium]|nr:bifunctional methionine sulfoxide reductase B/A protein [Pelagibacterales bacterium]